MTSTRKPCAASSRPSAPEPHAYLGQYPAFVRAFGCRAFGGVAQWLPPGVHVDPDPLEAFFRSTLRPSIQDDTFAVPEWMGEYHIGLSDRAGERSIG